MGRGTALLLPLDMIINQSAHSHLFVFAEPSSFAVLIEKPLGIPLGLFVPQITHQSFWGLLCLNKRRFLISRSNAHHNSCYVGLGDKTGNSLPSD